MSKQNANRENTPQPEAGHAAFVLTLFSKSINALWSILAFGLILLAIVIAGLRLFSSEVSKFKPELEDYLSQQLGRKVNIKELKLEWPSIGPRLQIKQLQINHSEHDKLNSLVIANGVIAVDLWRSFFSLELITDEINLQGIQIQYNPYFRQPESALTDKPAPENTPTATASIDTISSTQSSGSSHAIINWLLKQRTIEIYDSYLLLKTHSDKSFSLALPVFTFHGGNNHHQLNGTAVTINGKKLTVKSELKGETNDPDRKIQLYIKANDIDLKDIPTSFLLKKYTKIEGTLAFELWADFRGSHMQRMLIQASADQLLAGSKKINFSIPENFYLWKRNKNNGWNFISTPIEIILNNKKLPSFVLSGNRKDSENKKQKNWSVHGLTLPVKLVSGIVQDQLPPKLKNWLGKAEPTGLLANIGANINLKDEKVQFDVHFDLSDFSIKQIDQYPGLKHIDARINVTENKAIFAINSHKGSLNLAPLFRFPLPFDHLSTTIEYNYGHGSKIFWDDFIFKSKNVDINSQGKLEFFDDGDGYLELSTQLKNGNAKFTSHFLPVGLMSKDSVEYLDNSIRSGVLKNAKAVARGRFKNFPYINNDGVFDVQANVKNIVFKFLPDWPELTDLNASLRFHADSMDIMAHQGMIEGIKIKKTTAKIPHLSKEDNRLLLDIHAQTNGTRALAFLSGTALKNISNQLDFLTFDFDNSLHKKTRKSDLFTHLNLDIPLNGKKSPRIKGAIDFVDADVAIKHPFIPFHKLNGKIQISAKGLEGGKLKGLLWQQPFSLQLTRNKNPYDRIIGKFSTHISSFGINQLTGLNLDQYISGMTDITGKVTIGSTQKNQIGQTHIDIQSSLENLDIHLPDGLDKKAAARLPLDISINRSEKHISIKSSLGDIVAFSSTRITTPSATTIPVWKSYLNINLSEPSVPPKLNNRVFSRIDNLAENEADFIATVQLPSLTIDHWSPLVDQIIARHKPSSIPDKAISRILKLNTRHLVVSGFNFGKMNFDIQQQGDFKMKFSGDQARGDFIIPEDAGLPVKVNFERLHLIPAKPSNAAIVQEKHVQEKHVQKKHAQKKHSSAPEHDKTPQPLKYWQASNFPALKIHCESCQYNTRLLGSIDLETIPSVQKALASSGSAKQWIAIKGRWYHNPLFQMNFSGIWDDHHTRLQGEVLSDDFDQFNKFWDLSSGVKKSKFTSTFLFQWPGAPWNFNLPQLEGKISTTLSSGYIEEISTQGAQVFSLFSLQNLKRRLTLDFKDVFEKGFFYDDISGSFLIKQGIAYTQGLHINGTAAGISITGSTNLVTGEYNQHMVVIPKLSSSLPVLAGWAISPQTALLALILDKLFFKPALDVVSRIDYQITGRWDDPRLIELGKKQKVIRVKVQDEP